MESRRAEISVGEPWDFEGKDGPNRLIVETVGTVFAPQVPDWGSRYLLLRVVNPFEFAAERVEWVIAGPRYEGLTFEMLAAQGGTAGIARLRPSVQLADGQVFKVEDIEYFMIGRLVFA